MSTHEPSNIVNYVLNYLNNNDLLLIWESLIGTGKSTLCKSIAKHLNNLDIRNEWYKEPIFDSLLNLFYDDPKKYAFSFQTITIRERVHINIDAYSYLNTKGQFVSIDRCRCGDVAFGLMHYLNGNISHDEFKVYINLLKSDKLNEYNNNGIKEYIVFLNCTPKKSRERIVKRGNQREINNCSVEYLTELHKSYMKVLNRDTTDELELNAIDEVMKKYNGKKIIYIDYNEDLNIDSDGIISEEQTFKILYDIIEQIKDN